MIPFSVQKAISITGGAFFGPETVYHDSFDRLSISDIDRNTEGEWVYTYLWDNGSFVAQQNLMFGVGPDNWKEMIGDYGLDTDRSYNEYIDILMMRGVFARLLLLY